MVRAEKIPARFEIGFLLPSGRAAGAIAGYHCWAEFYLNSTGWVPVDISEAWKRPSLKDYFFGAHDADRVQFSVGRDITLQPQQQGPPLNYFVYPFVEVNGREFNNIALDLSYQDVPIPPEQSSGAGRR
jgi:transglutaminase-like putative cysteine protease